MANLEPGTPRLAERDGVREDLRLREDGRVRGLVGECEVRPDPDELDRTFGLRAQQRVEHVGEPVGRHTVAPEPGVDLQVDTAGAARGTRRRDDLVERPRRRDGHVEVRGERVVERSTGRVEPREDPGSDPGGTQRESLTDLRGPEPRRAPVERRAC